MTPPRRRDDPAAVRRFLLERSPAQGTPRLEARDQEHALRVLRIAKGDLLIGLDGRGGAWPLRVASAGRRELELEPDGEPRTEPAPGESGAELARIELLVAAPRGARAETLVDRASQLGVAAIRFLATTRSRPEARELSPKRLTRLTRVAAEACKQCGRLWLPELHAPQPLAEHLAAVEGARSFVLDPERDAPWLGAALGAGALPARLALCVGPEGGFDARELALFEALGVERARLAPYVLRVETAAEAALAVIVHRAAMDGAQ